ncbi:hypothetical protein GGF32_001426 [Allomyces javanicus]|nr:hypothetical protein GGF32_001426 [Allomyces javanicus]
MPTAVALTPSPSGLLADAFASSSTASAALHALVPALSRPAPPPPADTAKAQQLASLLKSDLLKSGELGQIRAHLSARAFQLLSAQRPDAPAAQRPHDPVVLGLIAEYLAFYGLEHSLHTLLLETTTVRAATTVPPAPAAISPPVPATSTPAPAAPTPAPPSATAAPAPAPSNDTSLPPAPAPLRPVAVPLVPRLPPMTSSTADPTPLRTDPPRADSPSDVSEFSTSLSTRPPAAATTAPRTTDPPTASASSAPLSRSSAPARSAVPSSLAVPAPVTRSASSVSSIADECDTSIGSASASLSFSRARADTTTDDADTSLDTTDYSLSTASSVSSLGGGANGRRHGSAVQPRRSRRFKGLKLPDVEAYLLHKDVVLDL